jgi:hypothetical protein
MGKPRRSARASRDEGQRVRPGIPLTTPPELAAWIKRHGVGGRPPRRNTRQLFRMVECAHEQDQPLLFERDPAEGVRPPKRRPV